MDPVNVKVIYCRICGIKAKKCVKIFSNRGRGMGLENKILKCLMLSVKRSDHLPTRVCFPCIDRLDDYSQFLLHVKQAQVKLRAMLKSQGVHFKDERNNELIATWKALLAHQERESDFGERGRKRKRKMDEKIYDTSDSSSDSVSDDSSSDGDNVTDGIPPCKKIALSNNEMNIVGFPLKSEAPDIRSTTPDNTPVSKQNSMGNSQHSKSISSDLNTDASNVCSSFPVPSASSTVPSKVSQMQEDEITTSEEPISLAEGSSSSIHHPTTSTTSEISVTISPPLWFPTQMSDSMIVMPGTSGKPPSSGMVPFYIWNMPKGGTSTEVSRKSLPTMPIGKQNLPAPLDKPKISRDVLSTSHTLSKRSLQTKPAATTSSVGKIIVVMGSENSDALPTSVSSQNQTLSVDPDNSCISNLRSETSCVAQESPLKKSDLNETSVKTNFLSVNKSLILPNQGNEFLSKMSNGTEKSSSNSISPVNLESGAHVSNTTPNQILKESSQLNETLSDFEGMRDNVSSAVSVNSIQSVSSNTCLIQLPVSQNTGGINQNEGQNASSNSHVPTMVSNSDMSKNDVSATPQGAQDIVPTKSSHEVPGTAISSRMSVNSADLSSTHKPSSNKSDVVPGTINSVVRKGTGVELLEVERPSATASVVAKAGAPQSDLSTVSLTSVSDMGMKVTNLARPCVSSVISKTSGEDKEIQVFDLCDIPPLIPISESKLKHYSDLECDGLSASMPRPTVTVPTITVVNDLDLEPEPLVIDEVCVSDNSDSGAEVSFNSVAKKSKESKASKSDSSNAKKSRESKVSKSDSLKKISTPAQKSSEWLASESVGIDFTVNPDYSVVKCCLCSTGTYPFLITLASASDHCKFIHSLGTCSFGCIKCDFTTDEQVEIPQQLKVLHHHVSSGCPPPDAPDSGSPQKKAENGIDVAEVKMEPVDVYETALKNLKNSMQKVNMPRFRKLLTTFKPSSPAVKDCSQRNVKAEGMEGSSNEGQIMLMDTSRSRLFTRKGSTYICRICDKKTNSKHQVKMHIGRHKPCERERLLMIDFRRSCALSSGRDDEEMIFDIPRIKIEKDDSPQAMESRSDIEPLRCTTDSLSNISVTSLHDNSSTPKMSSKKTPKSVERNSDISERETSKHNTNQVKKSTATPSSSGVKIPFIKGEPHMFSSADKVTHKANTSDSFSFNPLLKKSSDGSGQSYVNPSRNFRSKPIVKPLYKSPTTHKEDSSPSLVSPVASSSSSGDDLKLKVEQPSPFKRMVEDKQTCQPEKKISFKIVKPSSDTSSPVGSKSKKLVNEGATIGKPSHAPHIVVRGNLNPMKVIRPKSLEPSKMCESKRACFVKPKQQSSPQIAKPLTNYESAVNFGSPMKSQSECMALNLPKKLQDESMTANSTNKLQNKSMTSTPPKKLLTESMTVNGVVLKVPFIKLQRLNLVNIDPRIGFVNESGAHCDNEENVNKGNSGDTRSGAMVNQSEKSCGSSQKPSTSGKHKKEGSEKSEESILGW